MNFAGITENSKYWIWQFGSRLSSMDERSVSETNKNAWVWKAMIRWRNDEANKEQRTIENLFRKNSWSVQAYADEFGLWSVSDWETLKTKDIPTEVEE